MTRLKLASWFRARMIPLVLATGLVVAASAPTAFYLRERYDLVATARADAARVGDVLRGEIEARPSLWRYGSAKLTERLTEAGLARSALRVLDADAVQVRLEASALPLPRWTVWGRSELTVDGRPAATIWVAADQGPLLADTLGLSAGFALLGLLLGSVLYLFPLRAIIGAERRIDALLDRLALTLRDEDRRRIARELHDGVGQAITAARLELLALSTRAGLSDEAVARIARRLDEALDEVRRSTATLAPPALAELGLPLALERHCAAFADAAGLRVDCVVAADLPGLEPEVETACYRIVQEALANTARHAGATRAHVHLRAHAPGAMSLEIGDDGGGLPAQLAQAGQGLEGIRERARLLGGEVTIHSEAGGGVRLVVILPAGPREAAP